MATDRDRAAVTTVRRFADPGNPAPGQLEQVRRFVNTSNDEKRYDALLTPASTRRWLVEAGYLTRRGPLDAEAHDRLLRLREALRALAVANREGEPAGHLVTVVNHELRRGHLVVELTPGGRGRLIPAAGSDALVATLAAAVHAAMNDGTWPRLKACRQCSWGFYDRSRNRAAAWCDMQLCGSRVKSRRYRSRVR